MYYYLLRTRILSFDNRLTPPLPREGIPSPCPLFSSSPSPGFFDKALLEADSVSRIHMWVISYGNAPWETKPRNGRKQTRDEEEAKQRCDFRRNPIGAQEYTLQFGLKLRELGLCATSLPYSLWLYGRGVNKLPDILISLHMGVGSSADTWKWQAAKIREERSWVCRAGKKDAPKCQLYPSTNHALRKTLFHPVWPRVIQLFAESPTQFVYFPSGQMGAY